MATIIDTTYFIQQLTIAGLSNTVDGTATELQSYINRYEKKYLKHLLGLSLYNDFIAGLEIDPIPAKWKALKDALVDSEDKISPIANFVYYYYRLDKDFTRTTGTGEVKNQNENSLTVRPFDKMVKAWNDMVQMNFDLADFLKKGDYDYHHSLYNYSGCGCKREVNELFEFKNTLNV